VLGQSANLTNLAAVDLRGAQTVACLLNKWRPSTLRDSNGVVMQFYLWEIKLVCLFIGILYRENDVNTRLGAPM
jgi:hypothetical protein